MDIKKLVRKNILGLQPYTSARDLYSTGILLDANENSIGTTFSEIEGLNLNRYPDPHQTNLRNVVAGYLAISERNLFFGVGSDEIIDLLIRIFCEPGKNKVLIPEPTYGMFKVAANINEVGVVSVLLNDEFQVDPEAIKKNITEEVKIIFLCSPNNPTGNILNKNDILSFCRNYNTIIVVDEAYIDFKPGSTLIKEACSIPNLIVLRTFSKAWGLAGIRLGYCVADEKIIELLFKIKAPYNINSLTSYALAKAIKKKKTKDNYVNKIILQREMMKKELSKLPGIIKVFDSDANFLLIKCTDAGKIINGLVEKGIIIRDRSSQPKLENCLRISIGTSEQNRILLKALKEIVK